jgi:multisubunit Na+/H+ antiporter MnhG subunit
MKTLHKYAVMVVGAFFSLFSAVSFAAVPASVTTGITDAVTDVGTIGAAIMGVVIVIAAFAWMRRVVK